MTKDKSDKRRGKSVDHTFFNFDKFDNLRHDVMGLDCLVSILKGGADVDSNLNSGGVADQFSWPQEFHFSLSLSYFCLAAKVKTEIIEAKSQACFLKSDWNFSE